jgi:dTDP-3-amino-3,4,6-trideoxy-alpha-D-glucose transaminase
MESVVTSRPEIPRVDLSAPYEALGDELQAAIDRVLASGTFVLGAEVEAFEAEFAAYCGAVHCVAVNSGTDALRLALTAAGVGPGDEVVTTSQTAAPTAFAIEASGATPVFADVDADTYTLEPESAARAIGPSTRALVPVHLYGQSAEMTPLAELAEEHGLVLVEDACQAHGATYDGRRVGTIGSLGCFSFYPTKNLGAYGDGGAVVTDDQTLADRVRLLRNHGLTSDYMHEVAGTNSRLDELQAAILRAKLPHLDAWNEARRRLSATYAERLAGLPVVLPYSAPWGEHVFHLYVVRTAQRDALKRHLGAGGVGAGVHYPVPAHRQPPYASRALRVELPRAERFAQEVLSLPMFPELGEERVLRVADLVRGFFEGSAH